MFDFLKPKKKTKEPLPTVKNSEDKEDSDESNASAFISAGIAAGENVKVSVKEAAIKYAKPDTYTGNRHLYDDGGAKYRVKQEAFKNNRKVYDKYTGKELVMTKKEAKARFGDDWTSHLAEGDHIDPIKKVYDRHKNDPFVESKNMKEAVNSKDNMDLVSREINNAKRDRTNSEFVNDDAYLKKKGIKLSDDAKALAEKKGKIARKSVDRQLRNQSVKNAFKTGHAAGMEAAKSGGVAAGTTSGIMNIVAVCNGDKTAEQALKDTVKDTGKGALASYAMGNGATTITHTLSSSSSPFLKALAENNVPSKVIVTVIATGDVIKRYCDGEISTQECIIELGERGLNLATAGYAYAVGQALIPIPVVGGAIGALVGSVLTSGYYRKLVNDLKTKQLEHEERLRIIAECKKLALEQRVFRQQLEAYLETYFKDYQDCFDAALADIKDAFESNDADSIIAGANKITRKLEGNVYFDSVSEFEDFLKSDNTDVF